ncbi:hypothetical protein ACTA71_011025 [Dictyostelium dimigraforme]
MAVSKNIKSNVSTHVTKKPTKKTTKSTNNSEESIISKKDANNKLLSDEINEILHSENIKKSIDPESMDYFGDSAKVSKSHEDFGEIEDDNRGTRLKGDIPSEFTSGKYSGKKSSRKDNDMEEEDEVDQDNEYDIFGGGNEEDDSEDLDKAFDFQDKQDNEDDEDDDYDDDDDDDENVVVSSNIDRADMLFKKLQKQEKEEKQPKLVGHANEADEMEKAQNTKNQTGLYNEFLTTRILLQKTINCANKLPKPKIFKEFIELKDQSLEKKFKEVKTASCLLVSELYNLQSELIDLNDEIPKQQSSKKRIRPDQSLSEVWNIIEEQNQRLEQFHNQTITKWNNRISVASSINSGGKGGNSMKSLNQSILSQIQNTLNDFERLQKRTKLKRTTYRIIGDKQQQQQQQPGSTINSFDQNEEEKDEYDDEIFDDTDFYQTLLKDLESNNSDENEVGSQYWIEMRNLKKKKKKKVNQKASKGRILRYEVFPKLENFMTPQPLPIPDWNIDQLYQNLFGGLGNVNIKL